jgi:hypothetical protein
MAFDLSKIDWDLLRTQKMHLIAVIDDLENYGEEEQDKDAAESLTGILNLLDAIMDTAHDHHFPVMFLTEDEPEPIQSTKVQVRFRPQAWIREYAVDVDPEGWPNVWFIEVDSEAPALKAVEDGLDLDFLKFDPFAPAWITKHQGPFEIEIVEG